MPISLLQQQQKVRRQHARNEGRAVDMLAALTAFIYGEQIGRLFALMLVQRSFVQIAQRQMPPVLRNLGGNPVDALLRIVQKGRYFIRFKGFQKIPHGAQGCLDRHFGAQAAAHASRIPVPVRHGHQERIRLIRFPPYGGRRNARTHARAPKTFDGRIILHGRAMADM